VWYDQSGGSLKMDPFLLCENAVAVWSGQVTGVVLEVRRENE
jgi:hypothetical protein